MTHWQNTSNQLITHDCVNTEQKRNGKWGQHDAVQMEWNENVPVLLSPTVLLLSVCGICPSNIGLTLIHRIYVIILYYISFPVQARAYGSSDGKLTLRMVDECVEDMLQQHQQKQYWEKGDQTSTRTS